MGIQCCTDSNDERYAQDSCYGCPSVQLITKSVSKTATLCGWSEATDGGAFTPSSPPKKYRKLTITLSGSATGEDRSACGLDYNDLSASCSGSAIYTVNPESGACSKLSGDDTTVSTETTRTVECEGPGNCEGCSVVSNTENESPFGTAGSGFTSWFTAIANDSVDSTVQASGWPEIGRFFDDNRISTSVISDEDFEADALARAEETEGTSTSSIWQTRSTGFSFTKRTSSWCVLCTGLVPGRSYSGTVPLQKREAVIGTTDDWEAQASATFSFTATKRFQIEGGTLNAGITDDEFIEAGYSLNPTTYGLDADADVITPSTPLPHEQGREYEVGTNPAGDDITIDPA